MTGACGKIRVYGRPIVFVEGLQPVPRPACGLGPVALMDGW